ncbi:MAG: hypothetical protein II942_03245 [Alphaproteobacteria bacterium]|nr:hypothetical protein [Alphaproteobacteria bacterium]
MTEQTKNFYGLTKGEDGLYHSEYGDTFTEKDLRTGPWPAVMTLVILAGMVGCFVVGGIKALTRSSKKAPAIEQKQAVNPTLTNAVKVVSQEM